MREPETYNQRTNDWIIDKTSKYAFQSYSLPLREKIDKLVMKALRLKDKETIRILPYALCYGFKQDFTEQEIEHFIKIFKALRDKKLRDYAKDEGGVK